MVFSLSRKKGRQFGPDGNLAEWWEPPTKTNYLERAQCIISQYGNYSFPELNLNVNHRLNFLIFFPL